MSKFCAFCAKKAVSFFYLAVLLGLTACGGQAVKTEETAVEAVEPVVADADVSITQDAGAEEKPESVPEPVVEVMPQKQADEAQIAMEPIPAQQPAKTPEPGDAEAIIAEPAEAGFGQGVTSPAEPEESIEGSPSETASVPVSAGPDQFVITVGRKEPGHPAYGKGHAMGFLVDGVSGKELVVERGKTYTFEIRTDAKHDVYLSRKAVGWGGAPFAAGVEGDYTYKGKMTLKVDKDTPDQLFYACRNHPYMGAVIHVVDKGQKVDIKQQDTAGKSATIEVSKKSSAVTESQVKQKLMFGEMMLGAQGTKRVLASINEEAKGFVATAKLKLAEGHKKSQAGQLPEAYALANESLRMLTEAARLVPGDEELAQLAETYKTMLAEIQNYQKSYKGNLERMEKSGGLPDDARMDESKLNAKLAEAKTYADQKNYVHANQILEQAQATVTGALHKMLDSKTIVYDLKFETPADEYEYELKRFTGYEELIPVAIEAKKPAPGAIKLMESFLSKARSRRDEAIAKAEAGDYPMAIAMLLQATKTVRRALRMVGVSQ